MWMHKTWERNAEVAVVRETAVSFCIFLCAICISPTLYFAITLLAPMINSMEEVMSETVMSFKSNFTGPGTSGSIHFYHTRDLLQVLYQNSCNFKVAY